MHSAVEMMRRLLAKGGSIHRSSDVPIGKLVVARQNGDVFVDGEGNSFVWLPKETVPGSGIGFGVGVTTSSF